MDEIKKLKFVEELEILIDDYFMNRDPGNIPNGDTLQIATYAFFYWAYNVLPGTAPIPAVTKEVERIRRYVEKEMKKQKGSEQGDLSLDDQDAINHLDASELEVLGYYDPDLGEWIQCF